MGRIGHTKREDERPEPNAKRDRAPDGQANDGGDGNDSPEEAESPDDQCNLYPKMDVSTR